MTPDLDPCTLCGAACSPFASDRRRSYRQCDSCELVLADPRCHLSPAAEKAVYEQHQNASTDAGYRKFASRLFTPVSQKASPGAAVLDFGAGKSSALAALFREAGYHVRTFDPFFDDDATVFQHQYGVIVLSEVAEHLHRPGDELKRLWDHLAPGGVLGIQTQRLHDRERFLQWRYKEDPTHVAFYTDATMQAIAERLGASVELHPRDVAVFSKRPSAEGG